MGHIRAGITKMCQEKGEAKSDVGLLVPLLLA